METVNLPIENLRRFAWWQKAAMVMLAMMASASLWATDFIIDVKLIGGSKSTVESEIEAYKKKGWTLVDKDLNAKCGAASDYIYLIYLTASDESNEVPFITDFYLSDSDSDPNLGDHSAKNPPNEFTDSNGRVFYLSGYRGDSHFTSSVHGNLNSKTSGDNIYLYYTRAKFPDRHGVTAISFNDNSSGAVGKNGGSKAYDVNAGASGEYIYMHLSTATIPLPTIFNISTVDDWNELAYYINNGIDDCAGKYARLNNDVGTVTEIIGISGHPFRGTFYGDWNTLNVDINLNKDGVAPFGSIDGATIVRLNVTGFVYGANHAAGLVGGCASNKVNVIEECNISTNVHSPTYAGGIVGHGGHGELTLMDCLYNGTIGSFGNYAGGLLGWCDELKLKLKDCVFNGQFVPGEGGKYHPIACKNGQSPVEATIERAFYKNTITPSELGDNLIPGGNGIPVSYLFDFEKGMDGWTLANGNASGIVSNDQHTGNKCFMFASSDQDQMLISPQLPGYGKIYVYFYMRGEAERNISFQIGTSTTTNDLEAFKWSEAQTILVKNWSATFAEINAGAKYLAIKYVGGSSALCIDDICIEEMLYKPAELNVDEVLPESAEIAWTGNAETYNVRYRQGPTFYESFDIAPISWRAHNEGGNSATNWAVRSLAGIDLLDAHSGTNVAMGRSLDYANQTPYAVDNWLVSPQVTLGGTLSFWLLDDGSKHEHYEIWVSTTTIEQEAFEFVAEPGYGNSLAYQWQEITVDLSKYEGMTGYIAFRLKDEGKDLLLIDDVSIYPSDWITFTTTEPGIALADLKPGTTYEIQVQGVKGNETTNWSSVTTFTTATIEGQDVNKDGTVDTQDVLGIYDFMQQSDGSTPPGRFDVNHDGLVDTQDVLEIYKYIQEH